MKADIVKHFRKRPEKASDEMKRTLPSEQQSQLPTQQLTARAGQPIFPRITKQPRDKVLLLPTAPAATTSSDPLEAAMMAIHGAGDPHGARDPHGAGDPHGTGDPHRA